MNYLKISQQQVELNTLSIFLNNQNFLFDETLIDYKKQEPTDIRYNGINYQITEGDKMQIQKTRQVTSKKGNIYSTIRDTTDIIEILLGETLRKKSLRSDSNTVLLVEVFSTGGYDFDTLSKELSTWSKLNANLCNCWKEIYLVYPNANIRLTL